ncbi:MAG: YjiH family protein [Peptoniphilaceae bacterium]|nr:YjiH family protein [Peptoniphilaceae bacterium]MDY6085442.1 YjiH family protein [Peptoniphilaceae bacterium]
MATKKWNPSDILRFVLFSLLGIFMFFVPITINGSNTIPIDHITNALKSIPNYGIVVGTVMVLVGVFLAIKKREWEGGPIKAIFFALKMVALVYLVLYLFKIGPARFHDSDMLPMIFNSIMVAVVTIVPIGSIFLAFLTGFGLMEFIGVFMEPVMRPVFKTPGRSAVDAVASFVGSYSLALLITNRVYRDDGYTAKEAAIIATGFSTVSATFMIIVANTLDLMDYWLMYFWLTFFITFIVTAITVRIFPLSRKKDTYFSGKPYVPEPKKHVTFANAMDAGIEALHKAPSLGKVVSQNFMDGLGMALNIAPSLLGVGFTGLLLAEYTPIFDWIGYIFYPFTALVQIPEAQLTAKALALSIAEMLLPAPVVAGPGVAIATKMVVAIVSVSEIMFFSASIPVMMSTDIPIKFTDYLVIWVERTILSILLAGLAVMLLF